MKTSEFKKKIEELGLKVTEHGHVFDIHDEYGTRYASINRLVGGCISLNTGRLYLIKLCLEYAETPIEEREEEKRYRVRIPDSPERTPVYALCKLVNGCVVINQTNESNFQEHDRYRLTEAEIKRNHGYLWQFAKEVRE